MRRLIVQQLLRGMTYQSDRFSIIVVGRPSGAGSPGPH
jgi:hypothetical protein